MFGVDNPVGFDPIEIDTGLRSLIIFCLNSVNSRIQIYVNAFCGQTDRVEIVYILE